MFIKFHLFIHLFIVFLFKNDKRLTWLYVELGMGKCLGMNVSFWQDNPYFGMELFISHSSVAKCLLKLPWVYLQNQKIYIHVEQDAELNVSTDSNHSFVAAHVSFVA